MFRDIDHDVVFFENAMNFKYYPHMVIHCVPIPYESGNLAPIYFKKAILECEKEWAQNKKLVDFNKMDVKRVIPKGLPYFMVHFGMDNGFAHVIEDEKYFPMNFAQVSLLSSVGHQYGYSSNLIWVELNVTNTWISSFF